MMGIPSNQFLERDIFMDYAFESVLFRYEISTRRFFRKFYGEFDEKEVLFDNRLLNDARRFGEETDAKTYHAGKVK
jgi:hypothetical protein